MLFAPKSGRELREQLVGGASSKLLPPAPDDYPLPEEAREWGADPATAVAEPPGVDESVTGVETVPMADTVTFTEPEEAYVRGATPTRDFSRGGRRR